MKIGVDVSDLFTGRADGTTRYTRELARRFPKLAPEQAWHYFSPGPATESFAGVTWHSSPWPKYWTQSRFALELWREKPDVLFMPIQQLPILRSKKMKTVAVIHDLAFHYFPEQFNYKDWLLLHIFTAKAAREADHIIAVSQATANDIEKYYDRTKNVLVIHHGLDHNFFKPSQEPKTSNKQYILYVGQIQPRKNITRLVEAFELLTTEQPDLELVIAGGHGWLKKPILERIAASPVASRIKTPGAVSDEELRNLYWNAEAYVLPSLYEGFGMPILEAMSCGTPVVTSNVSSMPEISGGAAVLINPLDSASIAAGIKEAQTKKDTLRTSGINRAKQFTWDRTAQQTVAVLTQV